MYRDKLNFLFFLFIVLSILSCNSLDHKIQFRKKHIDKSIYDYDYKIVDNAITTEKITDNAITAEKIGIGVITNSKIQNGAIRNERDQ